MRIERLTTNQEGLLDIFKKNTEEKPKRKEVSEMLDIDYYKRLLQVLKDVNKPNELVIIEPEYLHYQVWPIMFCKDPNILNDMNFNKQLFFKDMASGAIKLATTFKEYRLDEDIVDEDTYGTYNELRYEYGIFHIYTGNNFDKYKDLKIKTSTTAGWFCGDSIYGSLDPDALMVQELKTSKEKLIFLPSGGDGMIDELFPLPNGDKIIGDSYDWDDLSLMPVTLLKTKNEITLETDRNRFNVYDWIKLYGKYGIGGREVEARLTLKDVILHLNDYITKISKLKLPNKNDVSIEKELREYCRVIDIMTGTVVRDLLLDFEINTKID